ncbi:carbonic anhydrase part [Amphidinium carterae]
MAQKSGLPEELAWTGRFCGGLCADLKRRGPFFASDWVDAFRPANVQLVLSSIFYLFFVCISPALAFGTLMAEVTEDQIGVVETIASTALVGVVYAVFAGQPLCIQGATGPELAYTIVFFNLCDQLNIEFLPARVWQGLWCSLFTVVLAMTDSCALMSHFTRFVEDIFAALISLIFLQSAITNLIKAYVDETAEVAFLTTLLCVGTYMLTMQLRGLKETNYGNRTLRNSLANFAAPISILAFTLIAQLWRPPHDDVKISMLDVPDKFEPTWTNPETAAPRTWVVNPFGINKDFPVWAIFATTVPAAGLALLGYLDQNLTTIIVNRPASGLQKPAGYHWDLFVCGIFVYPVCCILGLPFTHNSTAPSLIHLLSLTSHKEERSASGEIIKRQSSRKAVAGVVEQRFTGFGIHALIGVSLLIAPVLQNVPKSVTFGIFLVMGVTSTGGNQLLERLSLWCMFDSSTYPKFNFVTRVAHRQLHLYTAIQFGCFAVLVALTNISQVAVVFPFFMASLVFVRKAMKYIFSDAELEELDAREDKPMDDDFAPSKTSSKQHMSEAMGFPDESGATETAPQADANVTDA